MTQEAVRRLRRRSSLRPTSASASPRLRATYRAWGSLIERYRAWAAQQEDPADPAGCSPVSLRWVGSFDAFVDDMGLRPDGAALLRIDPFLPMRPGNCRWGEKAAPGQLGRRPSRWLTHQGQTRSLNDWARLLNIPYQTIYSRLRRGLEAADALGLATELRP